MSKDYWKDFNKLFVGMDQLFDSAGKFFEDSGAFVSTYPPYNTIKTDTGYNIELAVAGYELEDIDVSVGDKVLTVSAQKKSDQKSDGFVKALHFGLARRAFTKKFLLSDFIDKDSIEAELKNGILTISIKIAEKNNVEARSVKIKKG